MTDWSWFACGVVLCLGLMRASRRRRQPPPVSAGRMSLALNIAETERRWFE